MCQSGRLYYCTRCYRQVIVCSDCDRGQIYCSGECSNLSRQMSVREASARYQQTPRGKHNHAKRQQQYRNKQQNQKIVTHQGSPRKSVCDLLSLSSIKEKSALSYWDSSRLCCDFCKKPVSNFLRTNFLTTTSPTSTLSKQFVT